MRKAILVTFCLSVAIVLSANNALAQLIDPSTACNEPFIRGDANHDEMYDISDAVFILTSLFIPGSMPPDIMDAADANSDLNFDISDAVFILINLFAGGPDPEGPFPDLALAPTCPSTFETQIDVAGSQFQDIAKNSYFEAGLVLTTGIQFESILEPQKPYVAAVNLDGTPNPALSMVFDVLEREEIHDVIRTSDGNFAFVFSDLSVGPGTIVQKFDATGTIIGQATVPVASFTAANMIEANNGDLVGVGSAVIFGTSFHMYAYRVTENPTTGDLEIAWFQDYEPQLSAVSILSNANSIFQLNDGSFVLVGSLINGPLTFDTDATIVKVTSNGDYEWERIYPEMTLGAANGEFFSGMETADGGYLLLGDFDDAEAHVIKTIPLTQGDIENELMFSSPTSPANLAASDALEEANGDFLILGTYNEVSFTGLHAAYLQRLNSNLGIEWTKTFAYGGINYGTANTLAAGPTGDFVFSGQYQPIPTAMSQDLFVIRADFEGEPGVPFP